MWYQNRGVEEGAEMTRTNHHVDSEKSSVNPSIQQ
jgi:hypothetical protein